MNQTCLLSVGWLAIYAQQWSDELRLLSGEIYRRRARVVDLLPRGLRVIRPLPSARVISVIRFIAALLFASGSFDKFSPFDRLFKARFVKLETFLSKRAVVHV